MANIKQIKTPDGTTYDIRDSNLNGHTVSTDVPANAMFITGLEISKYIGTAGTSCETGTWLTQGSVTFEPGTYLIIVSAFFSANANGNRVMYFSSTSSGAALDGTVADTRPGVNGAAARLKFQTIKTFETRTTLYLRAAQNSGSTLTFTAEYSSIKII